MAEPKLQYTWTITPNLRTVGTVVVDCASFWLYQNHLAIKAKWTLKWTSDGTTGPSGPTDNTDRLTSQAACATRGTSTNAAQSWAVYENADGVQLLLAYQAPGTSPTGDDILKHGYSKTGAYTLNSPTTYAPTATDEVTSYGATATTVSTATTADRILQIWVRDDGKGWSCATYRAGALVSVYGVEQVTSLATVRLVNPMFDPAYVHYSYRGDRTNRSQNTGYVVGGVYATTPTAQQGCTQIRVYTDQPRTVLVGGGELVLARGGNSQTATGSFNLTFQSKPAAQNFTASILLPIYWSGDPFAPGGAFTDGLWASPIDWFVCYANTINFPAVADSFSGFEPTDTVGVDTPRGNWWIALGSGMIRPWRNAAASMETS